MAISMLKIRRPLGRLIFNMGIAIPGKTVFLIETAPRCLELDRKWHSTAPFNTDWISYWGYAKKAQCGFNKSRPSDTYGGSDDRLSSVQSQTGICIKFGWLGTFNQNTKIFIHGKELQNSVCKMADNLSCSQNAIYANTLISRRENCVAYEW